MQHLVVSGKQIKGFGHWTHKSPRERQVASVILVPALEIAASSLDVAQAGEGGGAGKLNDC